MRSSVASASTTSIALGKGPGVAGAAACHAPSEGRDDHPDHAAPAMNWVAISTGRQAASVAAPAAARGQQRRASRRAPPASAWRERQRHEPRLKPIQNTGESNRHLLRLGEAQIERRAVDEDMDLERERREQRPRR
jgi:hypothetical protein